MDPETVEILKLVGTGIGATLASYFVAKQTNKGKASVGEVGVLQDQLNEMQSQNESHEKEMTRMRSQIDRLERELSVCTSHRDSLIVERDKANERLFHLLLAKEKLV